MGQLKEVSTEFVICRVRRHRFEPIPDDGGVNRKYKQSRTVERLAARCERCTTVRYEAWNTITGEILFVQYVYPKEYKIEGDIKPSHVRIEFVKRQRKAGKA